MPAVTALLSGNAGNGVAHSMKWRIACTGTGGSEADWATTGFSVHWGGVCKIKGFARRLTHLAVCTSFFYETDAWRRETRHLVGSGTFLAISPADRRHG